MTKMATLRSLLTLTGIGHVEESVFALLLVVQLGERHWHAGDAFVVDEQVEGLVGIERHSIANDGDKLRHGQLLGHEKLGLVQLRQIAFFVESFDDDRYLVGKLATDALDLFFACD